MSASAQVVKLEMKSPVANGLASPAAALAREEASPADVKAGSPEPSKKQYLYATKVSSSAPAGPGHAGHLAFPAPRAHADVAGHYTCWAHQHGSFLGSPARPARIPSLVSNHMPTPEPCLAHMLGCRAGPASSCLEK